MLGQKEGRKRRVDEKGTGERREESRRRGDESLTAYTNPCHAMLYCVAFIN